MTNWRIFEKTAEQHDGIKRLPPAPPWRRFGDNAQPIPNFQVDEKEIEVINAALYLRRPLLVKGRPGTGKSSLAHAVAYQLNLGKVLVWPITSRSTVQDALYRYDAIGRLQDFNFRKALWDAGLENDKEHFPKAEEQIGQFIRLGPLGTALLPRKQPQVLLIDEIDKSDIDLPNDLLYIFEEGRYEIPELSRIARKNSQVNVFPHDSDEMVTIEQGKVACDEFPFVVITSNDERDLPPAFLRRCLTLEIEEPAEAKLKRILEAHFDELPTAFEARIQQFLQRREDQGYIATDQLLNAIYLLKSNVDIDKPFPIEDGKQQDKKQQDRKQSLLDFVLSDLGK